MSGVLMSEIERLERNFSKSTRAGHAGNLEGCKSLFQPDGGEG